MKFNGINSQLFNSVKFQNLIEKINNNQKNISLSGLVNSSKAYVLSGIFKKINRTLFIITSNNLEAKNLYEDISLFTDECIYFQGRELVFYNIEAISSELKFDRIKKLKTIEKGFPKIVCTSIESFVSFYMNPSSFKNNEINILRGQNIIFEDLIKSIFDLGYDKVSVVEKEGEFCVRGGIIDIFPVNSKLPYRLEFFGDELEVIRSFNTQTQRSIDKIEKIKIIQAREFILTNEQRKMLYDLVKEDFEVYIKNIKDNDVISRLESKFKLIFEKISQDLNFEEYNVISAYLNNYLCSFSEFVKDSLVIVDDVKKCEESINCIYDNFKYNFEMMLLRGEVLPNQIKSIIDRNKVEKFLYNDTNVFLDLFGRDNNKFLNVDFETQNVMKMNGSINLLVKEVKDRLEKNYCVIILSSTITRGKKLRELFLEYDILSTYDENLENIKFGQIIISEGYLSEGYDFKELKLYIISDSEVFGENKKRKHRTAFSSNQKGFVKVKSFSDLKPGDYIVHVNHGIGVYKGIKQIDIQGFTRDYLDIEYDKKDKLYVPIEQLDLVQKFIGIDGRSPKINKLGGNEWVKTKVKAKKSINEIAENLVKLYAQRNILVGYSFSKDTDWQKQFEDDFPYEETPDQLSALEDIKKDMESTKPMDRLLCGDVGYGKTEVALRAAFKSVIDKKQVAFLVPTTILADQHYNNIKKRFDDFNLNIDVLSRFRTKKQQIECIHKLETGEVDIVVGTHRLLSKDVVFKDLGLLIIDEEQRFGVKHKEKIKELKKNIDVLSLSATPIPRTLHMSMVGIRDISVIETPPESRYPIQTYVVEYSDQLVRESIIRELSREGQGFFVYNSVETIEKMNVYLQELVPECKFGVIHGQMNEREIEDVVIRYLDKEIDFLICTTIIETGIDIENANTIIVYNSDKMGLSQLYQLRGRVGRSNKIAYAYLTYKKDKVLTEVAEKRLKTLKDFTELGSGFKIAMKDLEIRGSGNLIGEAQHGQMSVIGYDLYCKMLEDTIKILKGEIDKEEVDTVVDIKINAYIKDSYIDDESQKIQVYKKISCIENKRDMEDIKEELIDRFSEIPKEVSDLIKISYIRALGKKLGFIYIKELGDNVVFKYADKEYMNKNIFEYLFNNYSNDIVFSSGDELSFSYNILNKGKEKILDAFIELLENLVKENKAFRIIK